MVDQDNIRNAAGYFNSPSKFGSPAGDQKKEPRRSMNVVPVTISQILQTSDDGFKVGGTDVHLATFVGIVKSVDNSSTKVSYEIQDETGSIHCHLFLETSLGGNDLPQTPVVENSYYRAICSVRMMQGKPYVMVLQIFPLTELNELTSHLLEVIHLNVKSKKLLQKREMQPKPMDITLSNSLMGASFDGRGGNMPNISGAGGMMNGLTPQQQVVYNTIQTCMENCGIHKNDISKSLHGRITPKEVENILEFLSNEGHVYSTIDDEHFKTTESC